MHRIDKNDPYRNMGDHMAMDVDANLKALSVRHSDHNLHTYNAYFSAFAKVNRSTANGFHPIVIANKCFIL